MGVDLSVLASVLEGQGYAVVAPTSLATGQQWLNALRDQLRTVDLVVAVFASGLASMNAAFELGLALGTERPVLVIASPGITDLPLTISSLFVIRSEPTNRDAISFALEQIDAAPIHHLPSSPREKHYLPLGQSVDGYLARLSTVQRENEIIGFLADIFKASGVDVVTEARLAPEPRHRVDLALWSDALSSYVGNPLIIEVKRDLRSLTALRQALAQITNYINAAGTQWGLLLFTNGPDRALVNLELEQTSRVIAISVEELLEQLRTSSFVEIIRALRNKKVHGVAY